MMAVSSMLAMSFAVGAPAARAAITETGADNPGTPTTGVVNYIGTTGAGALTIDSGSTFSATGLGAGLNNSGVGTVSIDGTGTKVTLTGLGQFVSGNQGQGSVTISGGAVLDGSAGTSNSFVGLFAGSTGSLTVTGTGSTFSASTTFNGAALNVGTALVWPTAGTVGGTAIGTVTVSAGGTINSSGLSVGQIGYDSSNPSAGSGQTAIGSVSVTGTNSVLNINPVGGNGSTVNVGANNNNVPGSTGNGTLSITSGGALNITTNNAAFQPGINIGGNGSNPGGTGLVTVNNGKINFNGTYTGSNTPFINVGRNQSTGTLNVNNGGTINNVDSLQVGRDGSTGTLTISGANSTVNVVPEGTAPAFVGVGIVSASPPTGVTTATGTLNVQNGGALDISLNGIANNTFTVGQRGGSGTVNVTGTGSQLVLSGDNANSALSATTSGIQVGRSGAGALNVTAGGKVIVNDTPGYSYLNISGSGSQANNNETAGTGNVLVSGAGSAIDIQSAHGNLAIGRSGTGSLSIQNGGVVNAENANVGVFGANSAKPLALPGSVGNLVVSGAGSQFNLSGNDGAFLSTGNQTVYGGARLNVGLQGTGTATFSNGAAVSINPTTDAGNGNANPALAGGLYIGGGVNQSASFSGGTGTVNVTGASTVTIGGTATNSVVVVGGNGTGTLNVGGAGSSVSLPSTGSMYVGAAPPGEGLGTVPLSGSVSVSNGASINAGSFLGIGSDGTNNNTGTGSFILTNGSVVTATNIVIGQHGLFGGNGIVNGSVTNNGGTIQVGASPDTLVINGAYVQNGGVINLEVFTNPLGGFLTDTLVFTDPTAPVLTNITFNFDFVNTDPTAYYNSVGTTNLLDTLSTFLTTTSSTPLDLATIVSTASSTVVVTTVPEPATTGVICVGLVALAGLRMRRRQNAA